MARSAKGPQLLSPSRLTIGSASVAGFVWMTAAMGPIVLADEPILVDFEQVPDPVLNTVDHSTDLVAGVEPAPAPSLIIIEIRRRVAADPAELPAAADQSAAPQDGANQRPPAPQVAPEAKAAPKAEAAPKAKERVPAPKPAPKKESPAPAPPPPAKGEAPPPQTKASG